MVPEALKVDEEDLGNAMDEGAEGVFAGEFAGEFEVAFDGVLGTLLSPPSMPLPELTCWAINASNGSIAFVGYKSITNRWL